ncbi:MAG: TlpA family protein disulfide reductase [Candidatus Eremiobacteraeota bacterium]|uniref:Thioredoxin domain-containing protein n=1 Tax=mine drainage metagenome TaxID=410659 RepID=E6PCF7_9ZZZZ|nr:TlpA disulfide reductase family protein [Candidatus Eremiobacteraeota bacterium]NNM93461.1 TlpA family protein disulfide reductase [Candidatus Eremiobacteraeota bacterium]NNM99574.1 TlpA family protein disulfide reductase [Candidatus Eremiobacteraeota bacterium]
MNGESAPPQRRVPWGRILDIVAVALILFALWKLFVAPRFLNAPGAYPAPRVSFARLDGGAPFTVASARGHVLFLDFFATWCTPCRAELPFIQAWERAHPQALVVPVDVGEPRASVRRFAVAHAMKRVVLDPEQLSRGFFQVLGFPTMVVIDARGNIRATWTGFNPAIGLAMSNALQSLSKKR